jgi:hypothetical protein
MNTDKVINGHEFYIKKQMLKRVEVDKVNWLVYYIDEKSAEKWVEEYPQSEYHGGGAPQLRLISKFPWE